jgi:hypothetical protein
MVGLVVLLCFLTAATFLSSIVSYIFCPPRLSRSKQKPFTASLQLIFTLKDGIVV